MIRVELQHKGSGKGDVPEGGVYHSHYQMMNKWDMHLDTLLPPELCSIAAVAHSSHSNGWTNK